MDIPQKPPQGTHLNKKAVAGLVAGALVIFLMIVSFAFSDDNSDGGKKVGRSVNLGQAHFLKDEPDSTEFSSLPTNMSLSGYEGGDSLEDNYIPPPPDEVFSEISDPERMIEQELSDNNQPTPPPPSRARQRRQGSQQNEELQSFREAQQSDGMVVDASQERGRNGYAASNPYNNNPYGQRSELQNEMQGAGNDSFNHANHSEISSDMTQPRTPYTLMEGHLIPATLETGISSQMPGNIRAFISRDIYDSITMEHLVIPRGSRLVGSYDERVVLNQSKLLMSWERLIYPDGRSIYLPDLNSYDLQGQSGISGQVDRHFWQIFGQSALLSLIGAGINASAPQQQGFAQDPSLANKTAEQIAQDFNSASSRVLDRNMRMAPTITIEAGKRFNIFLAGDISFPQPYEYSPPTQ